VPLALLHAVCLDLTANLETQLRAAKGLTFAATSYKTEQDPQTLGAIVRDLEQIRALHEVTLDILYSAQIALDVAHHDGKAT
jgi:hypothetical protein